MCGIVGCAGDVGGKAERMFRMLLELDTVRGPHSTGIAAVRSTKEVIVAKGVGTPWDLAETKKYEEIFRGYNKALIGHNRWATKGKISKANAHPFEFDTVVGVHNGTLRSVTQLDDHKDFIVDSENLYHHMDRHGVYDTIPKLDGAFALVWYNKDDHTINFVRNTERPLHYCYSEDMKTLFWASEEWMLLVASSASTTRITKLFELPVATLHTFDIPRGMGIEFDKVRTRKLELYKAPVVVRSNVFHSDNKTSSTTDTKVVALRPAVGKVQKALTEYLKYVEKEIVFYVGNKSATVHGQPYIQCWLEEDEDISVRVFAQEDSPLWKLMMFSTNCFSGFVKSYGDVGGKYLTVDLRTVQEVVPAENDLLPELYPGFDGELITEQTFDERTKKGCSWCSSHVSVDDADDIAWISRDEFICPDCPEQPEVKDYLVNAK